MDETRVNGLHFSWHSHHLLNAPSCVARHIRAVDSLNNLLDRCIRHVLEHAQLFGVGLRVKKPSHTLVAYSKCKVSVIRFAVYACINTVGSGSINTLSSPRSKSLVFDKVLSTKYDRTTAKRSEE